MKMGRAAINGRTPKAGNLLRQLTATKDHPNSFLVQKQV
jgi:hypothetical protein